MKHTVATKFVAILLAAVALVTAAAAACGIAVMGELNIYSNSFQRTKDMFMESKAEYLAKEVLDRYTARTYGKLDDNALNVSGRDETDAELTTLADLRDDSWVYCIEDETGRVRFRSANWEDTGFEREFSFAIQGNYPVVVPDAVLEQTDVSDSLYRDFYYEEQQLHFLYYYRAPEHTVTVRMQSNALTDYSGISESLLLALFEMRYFTIGLLAAALLVFAICMVYLCCAAGRRDKTAEPAPGGLNKLPLDIYLAAAVGICFGLTWLGFTMMDDWFFNDSGYYNYGVLALVVVVALLMALVGVGFIFACAAQIKMRRLYWLRNTAVGWCARWSWRLGKASVRGLGQLIGLLPVMWQWILLAGGMFLVPALLLVLSRGGSDFWMVAFLLSILGDFLIVCYGAYAYGTLLTGAKRMAGGHLDAKIPTRYLVGVYRRCAEDLNALAEVATVAARNQLRSERMKTELITNVSHDIKTPLTSIINYVDLLCKPHTQAQEGEYLEVLGRQSQRMKKLIEDLVEMSKATSGSMTVEIGPIDAGETLHQALGEFSDKLARARLTPVFSGPETPMTMLADGRLTWRVLSNLLSNAVKYAMPDTRLYVDLVESEEAVLISLKNISREPLNVSADELTERFVRGDASRNTEGSGLGLNIAQSLMELQRGSLRLLVDGDLFKVTLCFPKAEKES